MDFLLDAINEDLDTPTPLIVPATPTTHSTPVVKRYSDDLSDQLHKYPKPMHHPYPLPHHHMQPPLPNMMPPPSFGHMQYPPMTPSMGHHYPMPYTPQMQQYGNPHYGTPSHHTRPVPPPQQPVPSTPNPYTYPTQDIAIDMSVKKGNADKGEPDVTKMDLESMLDVTSYGGVNVNEGTLQFKICILTPLLLSCSLCKLFRKR